MAHIHLTDLSSAISIRLAEAELMQLTYRQLQDWMPSLVDDVVIYAGGNRYVFLHDEPDSEPLATAVVHNGVLRTKRFVGDRLSTCAQCEHQHVDPHGMKHCQQCGCLVNDKAFDRNESCPMGKWSVYLGDDE